MMKAWYKKWEFFKTWGDEKYDEMAQFRPKNGCANLTEFFLFPELIRNVEKVGCANEKNELR